MKTISIVTTMTNPSSRNDPWEEALACYEEFADEIVVVGDDWPYEFTWSHIVKLFKKDLKKLMVIGFYEWTLITSHEKILKILKMSL